MQQRLEITLYETPSDKQECLATFPVFSLFSLEKRDCLSLYINKYSLAFFLWFDIMLFLLCQTVCSRLGIK